MGDPDARLIINDYNLESSDAKADTMASVVRELIADGVHMIHSVDSLRLAKDINRHAEALGRVIPVLIEVNSAREEQKSGVFPEEAERLLVDISELGSIKVSGLMTMGPVVDDPELLRPYFRNTKALFDTLSERYGFGDRPTLSMGMSADYERAILAGANLVRVGTAIFGQRYYA